MIKATYPQMIKRICSATKLAEDEVERRVLEKKSKLSDLISKEGAAQIVAAELGVDFDGQKVKLDELISGMRRVSVTAKILRIFPARAFKTKNDIESKVMNMFIADDTGNAKCVLWDVNQIKLIEDGKMKEGDVVEIKDGNVKENLGNFEIHLGSASEFKLSNEVMEKVIDKKQVPTATLAALSENSMASVRAVIVQIFEPRFFMTCPECKKKAVNEGERFNCQVHGAVIPKEKALITLTIDDGTANLRAVGFSEVIKKLFSIEEDDIKNLGTERRNAFLGKEMVFSGRARKNPAFNTMEFLITDIEEVNVDKLIEKLGSK